MIVNDYTALLSDWRWQVDPDYGRIVVTYSMPANLPDHVSVYDSSGSVFHDTFSAVRGIVAEVARQAADIWEGVGNIQLVEVHPSRGNADIMMGVYDFGVFGTNTIGYAYYPSISPIGGDIFIDEGYATNLDLWLHEFGHALGLDHPHDGENILASYLDNTYSTVMSYNGPDTGGLGTMDAQALSAMYPGGIEQNIIVSEYEIRTKDAADTFARLRDFDGNDLGSDGEWRLISSNDVDGDGRTDLVAVNDALGRWATLGVKDGGLIDFSDHSWGGDTRVVGTYIDPLVQSGTVTRGSPFDSQQRFTNDLNIGNLSDVIAAGDFDGDGLQELYFALTDETAYLHAYMHADGNIQYANYQSEDQMADFLDDNGVTGYDDWFYV